MTSMRTVDAVKKHWPMVFRHYGLPPVTGKKHYGKECPICGQKGKFRIDNKNYSGSWICVCGEGDGWQLLEVTQKKTFSQLAREIDGIIGNKYRRSGQQPQQNDIAVHNERVMRRYAGLPFLRGTDGESYLMGRGINVLPTDWIRYSPGEKTPEGRYPALYAIATDCHGRSCYLHRTFLSGTQKARIPVQKKMLSLQERNYLDHAGSVAIRLFPVSSTLGIAEGIETALSCKQITGCNTWSVLNAALMQKFKAPKGVKNLIIFADTDSNAAGHAAAFVCANKNILSDNDVQTVSVRWPEKGDFNDMLIHGAVMYEWPAYREHSREVVTQ